AGQVLFVVDDRDFAAKLAQAEAAIATAEASVATYATRLKLQQAMIDQAAASMRSAEADLSPAQLDFKRYTALATSDYASRQRYESADADSRKADAALGKARAALVAEQSQLAVLESQKREEQAKLAQARASLQLAQNDLDNTVIRAPVAGVAGWPRGAMGWTLTLPWRRARLAGERPAIRGPTSAAPAPPASPPPPAPASTPQPRLRDWIGVLAMVFGLFMAIMDVQIVTSSLTQIQGGLSATSDEISWVQTAYLIADVVMVPLSGSLSRLLSTRVLFVSATLG